MSRQLAKRCDLAVWELEPGLLGAFGDRLGDARSIQGPLVHTLMGHLHDRQLLLVSLKTHKLSEALQAVVSAHAPRQTLLVGPASAVAVDLAPGALLHATRIERHANKALTLPLMDPQPPLCGNCGDGPVNLEQPEVMVTSRWAYDAALAAERCGVAVTIALAVVVPRPTNHEAEKTIQPPHTKKNLARRAGGVIGSLWRQPKSLGTLWEKQSARWEQGEQFADALEALIQQLP